MVAHEKRNPAQLFCAVPTQNDLALSSLLFPAQPTQKLGYPALIARKSAGMGKLRFGRIASTAAVPDTWRFWDNPKPFAFGSQPYIQKAVDHESFSAEHLLSS